MSHFLSAHALPPGMCTPAPTGRLPKAAGLTPRCEQGQSAAGGRAVAIAVVAARADEKHLPTAGQATYRYPNRVQSRVPSCGAQKLDICLGTCDDSVVDASQRTDTRGPGVVTRAPPPSGAAAPCLRHLHRCREFPDQAGAVVPSASRPRRLHTAEVTPPCTLLAQPTPHLRFSGHRRYGISEPPSLKSWSATKRWRAPRPFRSSVMQRPTGL